jgi:hypothetical protein
MVFRFLKSVGRQENDDFVFTPSELKAHLGLIKRDTNPMSYLNLEYFAKSIPKTGDMITVADLTELADEYNVTF